MGYVCLSPVLPLLALLVTASAAPAQTRSSSAVPTGPASFSVTRAASPIKVDAVLDEPAWQKATVIPVDYEWSPGDNIPAPVKTDCLITYDERFLYVAFRAADPAPAAIRAHLMDRDAMDTLIQDDHVGLMLDTFNDERRGFQFRINPLGVQADAIYSEQDGMEDFSWDMIWASAGRIGPDGYIVEVALPLKQLRFQSGDGPQTWGIEAFRSWPRNVRYRLSSRPRDRNKACLLCQESKITGFESLAQGRNVEFDPTATFHRTDRRGSASGSPLGRGSVEADIGMSGRWSVTPNVTLNGAVNPDFSQVEADVAQLDVNQRFALFYPEKRPFFLEGIDFFTTPVRAVFTRTVADPYFGAKLTGKQGPNAYGVFVTRDRVNSFVLPSNQGSDTASIDDDVTSVVSRYRRDLGTTSTVGGLFVAREGNGYHNRQVGLDGFWRPTGSDAVRLQYIRSDTQYPGTVVADHGTRSDAFGGNALYVDYQRITRSYQVFGTFESYDSGFRSDSGFVPRVDLKNLLGEAQRRWWRAAGGWFNTLDLGVRGWRSATSDWTMTDQTIAAFVNYTGPYQTQVIFNMPRDIVVYEGTRYEYYRPNFMVGMKPNGNVNLLAAARLGGGVDFENARKATRATQLEASLEYRPARQVNLALQYDLDRLSVEGGRLYRANLVQLKTIYHLNVRTFLRAILQFTDIRRDTDLYLGPVDSRTRRLFTQVLFSYKLNPQTVLFAGYSDNSSARPGADLQRQNRTFFVKLGYAWVL